MLQESNQDTGASGVGRSFPVVLTVMLGIALSGMAFLYTRNQESNRLQAEFNRLSTSRVGAIQKDVSLHLEVLRSVRALYSTKGVSRAEFHDFTEGALEHYRSIQALAWIPHVLASDRSAFEESAADDGLPAFQILERDTQGRLFGARPRDGYFPLYYMGVNEDFNIMLGLDMGSMSAWRDALDEARDTRQHVATPAFRSGQNTDDHFSVLVFEPIYRYGQPRETLKQRRQNLYGFAIAIFRISGIVEHALRTFEAEGIDIYLYDESNPSGKAELYVHKSQPQNGKISTSSNNLNSHPEFSYSVNFDIAGQRWSILAVSSPEFFIDRNTPFAWVVLGAGLVFTALLVTYMMMLTGRTARVEQLVTQRTTELTAANKELDDFAYIVSHDLKEPLRGIHNYSSFVMEDYGDKLDGEGKAKLETLMRLTKRMENLIDSMLYYSRVGRVDLATTETDLNKVLAGVLDTLHVSLEEQNIEVRIPKPFPTIHCDQARVGEVFRNLVTNAIKYNDKLEKWIEIGVCDFSTGNIGKDSPKDQPVKRQMAKSPYVFYVRDNGIGIREKHHDAIFRIFKRLHGRNKFNGGTGAGLTIVKKVIERHKGRIWVESEYGQGTAFYFTLAQER